MALVYVNGLQWYTADRVLDMSEYINCINAANKCRFCTANGNILKLIITTRLSHSFGFDSPILDIYTEEHVPYLYLIFDECIRVMDYSNNQLLGSYPVKYHPHFQILLITSRELYFMRDAKYYKITVDGEQKQLFIDSLYVWHHFRIYESETPLKNINSKHIANLMIKQFGEYQVYIDHDLTVLFFDSYSYWLNIMFEKIQHIEHTDDTILIVLTDGKRYLYNRKIINFQHELMLFDEDTIKPAPQTKSARKIKN